MESQKPPQNSMDRQVYVLGWYGHKNLGDEAFASAFEHLWPEINFHFGDRLPDSDAQYDALWIGGGSFLDHACPGLKHWTKPIGFIGVGFQGKVHPDYQAALERAKIVIARNPEAREIFPRARVLPDLVFASRPDTLLKQRLPKKRVTVLLNDFVSPRWNSPDWVTRSYLWFQHEFAKACDHLVKEGYELHMIPMGTAGADDRRAAAAIIGRMERPQGARWYLGGETSEFLLRSTIAMSDLVLTQRFHGIVFAAQNGCPFISISAHDKLKSLTKELRWPGLVNYYGFNLDEFLSVLGRVRESSSTPLLDYSARAREEWRCISATVAEQFFGSPLSPLANPMPPSSDSVRS